MPGNKVQTATRLRIGLLLDRPIQERWVLDSVREALRVPGSELSSVIIVGLPENGRRQEPTWAWTMLERPRYHNQDLLKPVDVASELGVVPRRLPARLDDGGWIPEWSQDANSLVGDVDVWLCFTKTRPNPTRGAAPFGVWGIEIGDGVPASSPGAGAAEIADGSPVTMISCVDYAAAPITVLYRSYGATASDSVQRNRLKALCTGLSFPRRLLEGIRRNGTLPVPPATLPRPFNYPGQRTWTAGAGAKLASALLGRRAVDSLPSMGSLRQWQVAYYFVNPGDDATCRVDKLRYLVPPIDRFWADPFPVEHAGRTFVFVEELLYRTQRGRIAAIEVFEEREPGEPTPLLERPYHLSYPFTFEWEGSFYMIPETAANRTVELYRCERFPDRWRLEKELLSEVNAFDATLCQHRGKWWMFVNVAAPGVDACDELHLYSSTSPFGPWREHRANPVVSDVRCARPAGPLFRRGGQLFRPSQDDSVVYGRRVLINRVDVLNDQEYRETAVEGLEPRWRPDVERVHTLARAERLVTVDCMVKRRKW
jgi:hypothetical protein